MEIDIKTIKIRIFTMPLFSGKQTTADIKKNHQKKKHYLHIYVNIIIIFKTPKCY